DVTGCKTLLEMSERFDVPKATFSAWNTHERTSHELMVRLHLALGVPIEELALKPEDQRNVKSSLNEMKQRYEVASVSLPFSPQHATTILKSFCLANGQLIETGEIPYPVRRMNSFNLDAEKVIEV
ncbi:chromosome partitioning protein ParA, partial [Vibrio anguillarum]|nr:chromosome partitioning protein ParA [Vibrio anguillarum]